MVINYLKCNPFPSNNHLKTVRLLLINLSILIYIKNGVGEFKDLVLDDTAKEDCSCSNQKTLELRINEAVE